MFYSTVIIIILNLCLALAYNFNYPNGAVSQVTCDNGASQSYIRIGEKYYFLGDKKVNWFESAHLCRQFGGDLALIESAKEMQAISNALKSKQHENDWFWISGNDFVEIHKFASITNGLLLPFTYWSPGQPDLPGVEQCVHLFHYSGEFRMNNLRCAQKLYYLCQRQNYTRCWDGC